MIWVCLKQGYLSRPTVEKISLHQRELASFWGLTPILQTDPNDMLDNISHYIPIIAGIFPANTHYFCIESHRSVDFAPSSPLSQGVELPHGRPLSRGPACGRAMPDPSTDREGGPLGKGCNLGTNVISDI